MSCRRFFLCRVPGAMTLSSPSSPLRFETISFLSDYGLEDEFVGVVKSVVRSLAPDVMVIDITHNIAPHDVRAGGLALARASQYLAPGVVIAVVDPGVGSVRRAVALEVGDGQSILVGPDNGLLAPAVAMCGGATAAVVLDNPEFHLVSTDAAVGVTFAGRDIFAPVAAHLCLGVPLHELGTAVDVETLTPGLIPVGAQRRRRHHRGSVVGRSLWQRATQHRSLRHRIARFDVACPRARIGSTRGARVDLCRSVGGRRRSRRRLVWTAVVVCRSRLGRARVAHRCRRRNPHQSA